MPRHSDARARTVLPLPRLGAPPLPRVPRPERWRLANGLRVISVPRPGLPRVAMRLTLPAGSTADPDGLDGTAAMVGALLTEGTQRYDAEQLNARIDALGASVSASVGHDFAEVDLGLLSETLGEGIDLLAELLMRPVFPEAETERVRAETLDALDARDDEPANVADDRAAEELFSGHPYGCLTMGTREGVARVSTGDLSAFHAAHYRPDGSFLVVAGDFDPNALRHALERAFGEWAGKSPRTAYPPAPTAPPLAGARTTVPWPDAAQGEIRVVGVGMERNSPDWIPAAVANYLLGGSTITGRLGANLREDKGWTYGVRSGFAAALQPGGWVVETAVDVEVVDAALMEILRELERMVEEPVGEAELRRAKDTLILSLPRAFETAGRIVGRFGTLEAFGLPVDYWEHFPEAVQGVTAEEVLRIARTYFDPRRLAQVVVGYAGG